LSFLGREVNGEGQLAPAELYMVRTLLDSFSEAQTGQLRQRIAGRIGQMEQAAALAPDFPRVRAQVESGAASSPVWVPYGGEPWLVTMTPPAPPLPGLVVAVSSAGVVPPGVKLLSRSAEGDALGEAFPSLQPYGPTTASWRPLARACRWASGSRHSR
jgi:hypothetical protein